MINVILGDTGTLIRDDDFIYPVFDEHGEWCGMSTACGNDGNGTMLKRWCSFRHNQTWINTETNKSIILTNEFFNNSWGLNEYGMKEFKRLLGTADELELEPETEMPDIF